MFRYLTWMNFENLILPELVFFLFFFSPRRSFDFYLHEIELVTLFVKQITNMNDYLSGFAVTKVTADVI